MNCEYAIDSVIQYLTSDLETMLNIIKIEAGSSVLSQVPQTFDFGEKDPTAIDNFPAVMCKASTTDNKSNQYKNQERSAFLEVIFWVVNIDENELHRMIVRYGEAITRVLRDETKWKVNLYNPVIGACQYSDIYESSIGLAQAGNVKISIDYLIS